MQLFLRLNSTTLFKFLVLEPDKPNYGQIYHSYAKMLADMARYSEVTPISMQAKWF